VGLFVEPESSCRINWGCWAWSWNPSTVHTIQISP